MKIRSAVFALTLSAATPFIMNAEASERGESTKLLWGDTHLHTSYSGDSFGMKNETADPETAYRFAKGLPVIHPYHRARVQITRPLDFLVVSDHAEYMGMFQLVSAGDERLKSSAIGRELIELYQKGESRQVYYKLGKSVDSRKPYPELLGPDVSKPIWDDIIDAAERHYQPGEFTTFIGWEWSSMPTGDNLHRVVILRDGKDAASQFLPFSSFNSEKPEDLWSFLEKTAARIGSDFVAIPHNPNISNGRMFATVDSQGNALSSAYANQRMTWEPVVEVTQVKGDSETHSVLSPGDEFADFETFQHLMKFGEKRKSDPVAADYARSALRTGLEQDAILGVNPFKFGMIGASDIHSGLPDVSESNFMGKFGIDSTPETKDEQLTPGAHGSDMSSAGLAGVWAKENTRESIFDAIKRKEVYATTGTRITVRLFGGWKFDRRDADAKDVAAVGYRKGVPMGSDLSVAPGGKAPSFLIWAAKDPIGANLDRLQVVKGWLDQNNKSHEKVFNVAVSGKRKIRDNTVEAVGNSVDLATARYENTIGASQLAVVWEDPEFDAKQRAFYYVRVLEIPTPRHTLFDAVALGKVVGEGEGQTIQERAYTSPIWYTP